MKEFFSVFLGGLLILAAFIGWGFLFCKLILKNKLDAGFYAVIGLSIAVIVGGLLNLFSKIGLVSNAGFIIAGLCGFIFYCVTEAFFRKQIKAVSSPHFLIIAAIVILVLVEYSAAVSSGNYNIH